MQEPKGALLALALIGHPEKIWAISFIFLLIYLFTLFIRQRSIYTHFLLLPVFAWAVFGFWEIYAIKKGWTVRIDLFFIYLLILLPATIAGFIGAFWKTLWSDREK